MIDKIKAEIETETNLYAKDQLCKCLEWAEECEKEVKALFYNIKDKGYLKLEDIEKAFHKSYLSEGSKVKVNSETKTNPSDTVQDKHSRRTKPVFQPMGNEGIANPLGQDKNSDTFKEEAKT